MEGVREQGGKGREGIRRMDEEGGEAEGAASQGRGEGVYQASCGEEAAGAARSNDQASRCDR